MADTLQFELVSPERKLASMPVESVTIPGMEGDLTAMAHHAPFLTTLRPGFLVARAGGTETGYFVTGGFAEIANNTVSVLAELAIERAEVTRAWIDGQIAQAESALTAAADDGKQMALQRLNDYRGLAGQIPA